MPPEARQLKDLRILVVDDDHSNLPLVRRILEREGYTQVETTADPTRVPEMVLERPPDLLLLDLYKPETDRLELMKRLAAVTANESGVPFLVLTADASEDAKLSALSIGARDVLTKPFNPIELLLRVRNLLQGQRLQARLHAHVTKLEREVAERTRELDLAQLKLLDRLAGAAETDMAVHTASLVRKSDWRDGA